MAGGGLAGWLGDEVSEDFTPILAPLLAGVTAGPALTACTLAGIAIWLRRAGVALDTVAHLLATGAIAVRAGGSLHVRHRCVVVADARSVDGETRWCTRLVVFV